MEKSMRKALILVITIIIATSLAACSAVTPIAAITPTSLPTSFVTVLVTQVVKSEVTRIVQVTPTPLYTLTPTLNATQLKREEFVLKFGTPTPISTIVPDCFKTAYTNQEIISCAIEQRDSTKADLSSVVELAKNTFDSPQDIELFISFEAEWESQAERECKFWHARLVTDPVTGSLYYEHGRLESPLQYNGCLVEKYRTRMRELQLFIFYKTVEW